MSTIAGVFAGGLRETFHSLKVWPSGSQWRSALGIAVVAFLLIGLPGYAGGWLNFAPLTDPMQIVRIAAILFIVPAFLEELFFRGVLLSWLAHITPRWAAWISTFLFVLWHPLQALTFGPPWSELFLSPSFLFAALILGMVLSHVRIVTKSLWPAVMIHWAAVVLWKVVLGGPFL